MIVSDGGVAPNINPINRRIGEAVLQRVIALSQTEGIESWSYHDSYHSGRSRDQLRIMYEGTQLRSIGEHFLGQLSVVAQPWPIGTGYSYFLEANQRTMAKGSEVQKLFNSLKRNIDGRKAVEKALMQSSLTRALPDLANLSGLDWRKDHDGGFRATVNTPDPTRAWTITVSNEAWRGNPESFTIEISTSICRDSVSYVARSPDFRSFFILIAEKLSLLAA